MTILPVWCEGCEQGGEILIEDTEKPTFVVCQDCGEETSQVWCSKCQMGGQLFRNVNERPSEWTCSECKSVYALPDDFYSHATKLEIPFVSEPPKNEQFSRPKRNVKNYFISPLPQRKFAARLKSGIDDSFKIKWHTVSFSWKKPVAGEVWAWSDGTMKFSIFKRRPFLNGLAPRVEGVIADSPSGSTITAKYSFKDPLLFLIIIIVSSIISILKSSLEQFILFWENLYHWESFNILVLGMLFLILIYSIDAIA